MAATPTGTRMPAASSTRSSEGRRFVKASQAPGAPIPSIDNEIAKNAQWYQSTTLRMRVTAIWSSTTAAETSAMATCLRTVNADMARDCGR